MILPVIATLVLAQDVGVPKVVAAIAKAAGENAARREKDRLTGDALTNLLVRQACATGQPARSIVLGLAYALEPSGILARSPLGDSIFKDVESEAGRKARLAAMGRPTLRGREDWLAHFFLSAGLFIVVGQPTAEALGIQKEMADAAGKEQGAGSGFSFTDLSADLAGITFARWLTGADSKRAIAACGKAFEGANFLPDPTGLVDGYTSTGFEIAWGGVEDARFKAELELLRTQAAAGKGYRLD